MSKKFNEAYFKEHYKDWNKQGYWNYAFQLYHYFNPERILDIGCGLGYWMKAFYEVWDNGIPEVFGCDISPYAVKETNFIMGINVCSVGSINKIPYVQNFAELVTCFDVLEHIKEEHIDKALEELKRVTNHWVLCSICFKGDKNADKDDTHVTIKSKRWWINKFLDHNLKPEGLPEYLPTQRGVMAKIGNRQFASQLVLFKKIK